MALIECPECGKDVSDTAKVCPNCGFSLKKGKSQEGIKKNAGKFIVAGILILIVAAAGILFLLRGKDEYPVDLKSIGKQISDDEMESISKDEDVVFGDDGEWKRLQFVNAVKIAGVPMLKTIHIVDNKIIAASLGAQLQVNTGGPSTLIGVQNFDSYVEVEEKGNAVFDKFVKDATKKHGEYDEHVEESQDEFNTQEVYRWSLENGITHYVNAWWTTDNDGEVIYAAVSSGYSRLE